MINYLILETVDVLELLDLLQLDQNKIIKC